MRFTSGKIRNEKNTVIKKKAFLSFIIVFIAD